jgi:hypothetical protein
MENTSPNKKEREILKNWIIERWDDCVSARTKIEEEDGPYYYNENYEKVPVDYDLFETFAESDHCWCGRKCNLCERCNCIIRTEYTSKFNVERQRYMYYFIPCTRKMEWEEEARNFWLNKIKK